MEEKPKHTGRTATGQFSAGNAGKPKGAAAKTTKSAKEAIALAAEGLGGVDRLVEWAKEDPINERAFWGSIYPKLIPVTLAGDNENPVQVQLVKRVIIGE